MDTHDTRAPIVGAPECQHVATHRGANIPRAHGSYRSEVCDVCGAFRARDHHDEIVTGHNGGWRLATEYVEATSSDEEPDASEPARPAGRGVSDSRKGQP